MKRSFLALLLPIAVWGSPPQLSKDMPGHSFHGPLPSLSASQKKLSASLRADVEHLALKIGERNQQHYAQLQESRRWVASQLQAAGYAVHEQTYRADGLIYANLECALPGQSSQTVVVGAHYDSVLGSPGADDNASGVAALLALARALKGQKLAKTVRFVAFTNEEPEHFQTQAMGSLVYALFCQKRGDKISSMLSLESIGYYSDAPGSEHYPAPLGLAYPSTGNFIVFVGNTEIAGIVKRCVATFRKQASFPSEGAALPAQMPGVGWSDHWSFWKIGVPAVEITDTVAFRNPNYHRSTDLPESMDFDGMARVVEGLQSVVVDLAK